MMDLKKQDEMVKAINFWMGVECLSPNTAPDIGHDKQSSSVVTWKIEHDADWPWNDSMKKRWLDETRERLEQRHGKKKTWSFVAYCALTDMNSVVEEIRATLGVPSEDETGKFKPGKPPAALVLTLNEDGIVTGDPFISSMPWAMGQLINTKAQDQLNFSGFFSPKKMDRKVDARFPDGFLPSMTKQVLEMMAPPRNIYLGPADEENPPRPITLQDIEEICTFLFDNGGWRPKKTLHLRIRTKLSNADRSPGNDPDDDVTLNSFYVDDLESVSLSIQKGDIGQALMAFMSGETSPKINLRQPGDKTVFKGTLPKETPLGCWPLDHSLVLAQQFAVNAITKKMAAGPGIFSVNGPPGTGKTTLLRDIVANIIVDRAIIMATYDDPLQAYHDMSIENWDYGAYRLDSKLTGKGIVVASANNGAVENITKELPGIKAIPKGCSLRYFSDLSDSIVAAKDAKKRKRGATWGLIAAVLGRKENKDLFFQRLCWPKPKETEAPSSLVQEDPLVSLWTLMHAAQGTKPWSEAKAAFAAAHDRSLRARSRMQEIADAIEKRTQNQSALKRNRSELRAQLAEMPTLQADRDLKEAEVSRDRLALNDASGRHNASLSNYRLFGEARDELAEAISCLSRIERDLESFSKRGTLTASALSRLNLEPFRYIADIEVSCTASDQAVVRAEKLLDSFQINKPNSIERFLWFLLRLVKPGYQSKWERSLEEAQKALSRENEVHRKKMNDLEAAKEISPVLEQKKREEVLVERIREKFNITDLAGIEDICSRAEEELEKSSNHLRTTEEQYNINKLKLDEVDALLKLARKRIEQLQSDQNTIRNNLSQARKDLCCFGVSTRMKNDWLNKKKSEEDVQLGSPWLDEAFFSSRKELFIAAMELHESFIINSWEKLKTTLNALSNFVGGKISHSSIKNQAMELWEALFLVVPVISTTFASISRMFVGCGKESLGWLLIDEAGQATPQQALGAIWRSKRVVVVGDPLQLEPIISLPDEALEPLRNRCNAGTLYKLFESSAQVLADKANRYGTYLGSGKNRRWVGSPLRVHRRCLNPMFEIANKIAYDEMMVYGTIEEKGDNEAGWFGQSCWIDIAAESPNGHSIPGQVDEAVALAREFQERYGLKNDDKFNLYIISPFRDVNGAVRNSLPFSADGKKGLHGTIHTFQGKEAEVVIIILGGDPGKPGVISGFAAAKANLLNVAVTRAKKRIYVIGDRSQWIGHLYFKEMENLPVKQQGELQGLLPDPLAFRPHHFART